LTETQKTKMNNVIICNAHNEYRELLCTDINQFAKNSVVIGDYRNINLRLIESGADGYYITGEKIENLIEQIESDRFNKKKILPPKTAFINAPP